MNENRKVMTIIGDIEEEYTKEVIETLYALKLAPVEEDKVIPIEIILSTYGGSLIEMFSIYDLLRDIKKEHEVHTLGIGKVMSAGVLILAAGTKGKRKIGENCRVMIHPVVAGCEGSYPSLENEMEEIRYLQNQYKKRLVKETNITMRSLNKYFKLGKNIYLSAEEALEMGMVDEIV